VGFLLAVNIVVFAGQLGYDDVGSSACQYHHRAVFTLGGIFLIGNPSPHHFARVGVVIGDRLVAKFG